MQTGTYISGLGHLGLIGWVLFGGTVNPEPLPFEVQQVAVISTAEFEALQGVESAEPVEPVTPVEPVGEPVAPVVEEAAEDPITPEPDPTPDPEPEAVETQPDPTPPAIQDTPVDTGEPPQPSPSERIASEAVEAPEPDTTPDEIAQDAVVPEEGEADTPQEPQEATAPEEATTEIVTEAEVPAAPTRSIRPATRPERPTRTVAQPEETPADDPVSTAVDDAVQAALQEAAEPEAPRAPTGPPLTSGERDALRLAVSSCWNVGSLSSEALRTTVVVGVSMQEDARPVNSSIRMLSFAGGSEGAARQAFEAARRAIIRCGSRGFQLPAEKYGQWQEIEMTFNPESMRIR